MRTGDRLLGQYEGQPLPEPLAARLVELLKRPISHDEMEALLFAVVRARLTAAQSRPFVESAIGHLRGEELERWMAALHAAISHTEGADVAMFRTLVRTLNAETFAHVAAGVGITVGRLGDPNDLFSGRMKRHVIDKQGTGLLGMRARALGGMGRMIRCEAWPRVSVVHTFLPDHCTCGTSRYPTSIVHWHGRLGPRLVWGHALELFEADKARKTTSSPVTQADTTLTAFSLSPFPPAAIILPEEMEMLPGMRRRQVTFEVGHTGRRGRMLSLSITG